MYVCSRTFRNEELCPAVTYLGVSECGNKLIVKKINNLHNHFIDENLFRELPQQRQLPDGLREDARKLLKLKANKHLIREEIEAKSHQIIKLKDLQNIQQEDKIKFNNSIEGVSRIIINQKFRK